MSDWLKWSKGLSRKREIVAVAAKMKLDRRQVAGMCMEIWEWADDNTTDGHASNVTTFFLDELVCKPGFADHLAKEGWLIVTADGIEFPNFKRHNGKSAKERALNKEAQNRSRNKCHDSIVTEALPEKRREDIQNTPLPPRGDGVSPEGDTPQSHPPVEPAAAERDVELPPGFARWWAEYPKGPRKVGRGDCLRVWKRRKLEPIAEQVIRALRGCKASRDWVKDSGQYVPQPKVWLNKSPWETDPTELLAPAAEPDFDPERFAGRATDEQRRIAAGEDVP